MDLVARLKSDAIDKGLCRLWQRKFTGNFNTKELVAMYIQGIDFCISEDFPTLEFLQEHFKGKCEPYGVFIDDEVEKRNLFDVVLNGCTKAILEYDEYCVARVFARHQSEASINVSDHAIVTIDAFDDVRLVVATAGSDAQVLVNVYGNAQVEHFGDGIKVIHKNKKTY